MLGRVWKYVTRKRVKTLIMGLVLFGIATAMLSGIAVKKAARESEKKIYSEIGAGFTVKNNLEYNWGTSRGAGNIPGKMLDEIAELPGVTKYSKRMVGAAQMLNARLVDLPQGSGQFEEDIMDVADIVGEEYSELDSKFLSGSLRLTEGKHLERGDKYKALVHETFAEANHLKVGDTIEMKASVYDNDNKNPSDKTVKVKILGLFSGKNVQTPSMVYEMCENIMLTDLETVRTLYNYTAENEIYHDAAFFTENPKSLEKTMKEAEKLPLDWKNYKMEPNGSEYLALTESVEGINRLVNTLLTGAFVAGLLILSLILFLWIHGRMKETGILLAVGVSKGKVILQYILELLLIAVVSFSLAFWASSQTAQSLGDKLVKQSSESAAKSIEQQAGGMLGRDMDTASLTKTLDDVDVKVDVDARDMAAVCGLGVLVIVFSVLLSSYPIVRMKPKKILSQMS